MLLLSLFGHCNDGIYHLVGPDRSSDVLSGAVTAAVRSSQPHPQDGSYFFHIRAVSFLWAFADDFFIRIRCEPGLHQSTIEMQAWHPRNLLN